MDKLETAIYYIVSILNETEKLTSIKLNKILWFADVITFRETLDNLTGVSYQKEYKGPVVKWESMYQALKKLEEEKKIIIQGKFDEKNIPEKYKTDENITDDVAEYVLGKKFAKLVKELTLVLSEYSDDQVSNFTHNIAYKQAPLKGEMPVYVGTVPNKLAKELTIFKKDPIIAQQ